MNNNNVEQKSINAIRVLSIDAIEKANSGHPGAPMSLAPVAYVLWMKQMHYNPKNPSWLNRDRFVLSNGHASMLQYATLHLTGFNISLDDIKNFRQMGSITAGHPEHGLTPGVDTTTGPLGQGIMHAVGLAIAEAHLGAIFNKEDHKIIDHYTYVICSDGDLMEGASHEAASLAGHLGLGKLIFLYDNNHISIEGNTNLAYSDNVAMRFEAYNWHVQELGEECANDIDAISKAYDNAKAVTDKPSIIILRTHIGYGSPNKVDTSGVHGSPLGKDEIKLTKEFYGWPEEPFYVPEDVKEHMHGAVAKGADEQQAWEKLLNSYTEKYPEDAAKLQQYLQQELPEGWDADLPVYGPEKETATRTVTSDVMEKLAGKLPWIMGGAADLGESTSTHIKSSKYFGKGSYDQRNMAWGVREHVMCAASGGMMLHGGVRPFCSTYFVFTDYAKPAIRLAAIMSLPVIYVMTHDSIGLGEDGKTHQPVEQLPTFRSMPGITIIRPGDANETVYAWKAALQRKDGPTMLVLSRQKLPVFDQQKLAKAEGTLKGAYILSPATKQQPDAVLISTGSEVQWVLGAQELLKKDGIDVSVVSMPSWEIFRAQTEEYRQSVIPSSVKLRVAVEAGAREGWQEWTGDHGKIIGMTTFGESAPAKDLFRHFGFTAEHVAETVKQSLAK